MKHGWTRTWLSESGIRELAKTANIAYGRDLIVWTCVRCGYMFLTYDPGYPIVSLQGQVYVPLDCDLAVVQGVLEE